jgi:SAM-dependent methyltransferase
MINTGSYQFEKLEGRSHEAKMLADRAHMRLSGFIDILKQNSFPTEGKVLEVGTAQGIRARLIAETFPSVEVIAIDRSDELLFQAKCQYSNLDNLQFQNADVYDLPFANNTFDFVYVRLVFMHLSNPNLALKNLLRVLKPGGRIVIEDADRDCMFFEPTPASFAAFWAKVQEGQRRLGGDPNVGRKLGYLLKMNGFDSVNTQVQTILGDGSDIDFLVRTLMPSLNIYLSTADREKGAMAIEDLKELSKNQSASFYHFWFIASGQKQ